MGIEKKAKGWGGIGVMKFSDSGKMGRNREMRVYIVTTVVHYHAFALSLYISPCNPVAKSVYVYVWSGMAYAEIEHHSHVHLCLKLRNRHISNLCFSWKKVVKQASK